MFGFYCPVRDMSKHPRFLTEENLLLFLNEHLNSTRIIFHFSINKELTYWQAVPENA